MPDAERLWKAIPVGEDKGGSYRDLEALRSGVSHINASKVELVDCRRTHQTKIPPYAKRRRNAFVLSINGMTRKANGSRSFD